jgi:hypothetical protein
MAFLDNSGDILLDAVLTDAGRKRMAEGTFRITKFALADDEIDYSLYNFNNSSGSAYYDLDILSTPILEAFTDNAAGLKSKLLSISRTDLEYLSVMKLFPNADGVQASKINPDINSFIVPVNGETRDSISIDNASVKGTLVSTNRRISVDQGIDNQEMPFDSTIDPSLRETQYIIELDSRLGLIRQVDNPTTIRNPAYIDDDQIASYILTENDTNFVTGIEEEVPPGNDAYPSHTSLKGQFGSRLEFSINPTSTLQTTDFLFEKLGATFNASILDSSFSHDLMYLDANVRVIGATTGYRLDIPVRFVKKPGTSGTL